MMPPIQRRTAARVLIVFVLGALTSVFASIFAVSAVFGALGGVSPRLGQFVTALVLCVALLLLTHVLQRRVNASLDDLGLTFNRSRIRTFALGFVISTALYLGVAGAQSAAVGARWMFAGLPGLNSALLGLIVTFVLVLAEELVFRGVALRHLQTLFGDRAAIVISAVLFGVYHVAQSDHWAMGAVFAFAMPALGGVLFAFAAIRSRGLALPLGLHMGGNWVQSAIAGFAPVDAHTTSALWRIPISADDVQTLMAPDVIARLPYLAAVALAALSVRMIVRRQGWQTATP